MASEKIGTFTPVEWGDGKHNFAEASDQYFSYLGKRTVKVINPKSRDIEILCEKTDKSNSPSKFGRFILTVLKIISIFTIVVPLIFAIGKAFNRTGKQFKITSDEKTPLLGSRNKTNSFVNNEFRGKGEASAANKTIAAANPQEETNWGGTKTAKEEVKTLDSTDSGDHKSLENSNPPDSSKNSRSAVLIGAAANPAESEHADSKLIEEVSFPSSDPKVQKEIIYNNSKGSDTAEIPASGEKTPLPESTYKANSFVNKKFQEKGDASATNETIAAANIQEETNRGGTKTAKEEEEVKTLDSTDSGDHKSLENSNPPDSSENGSSAVLIGAAAILDKSEHADSKLIEEVSSFPSSEPKVQEEINYNNNEKMCLLEGVYEEKTKDGTKIAKEEIKTLNSVDRTKKILEEEIKHLDFLSNDQPQVKQRIGRCKLMLEACKKYDGFDKPANIIMEDSDQWFGSWYFRSLITLYFNELEKNATQEDYNAAYENATKEFIASPVNLREQTVTTGKPDRLSFLRCGALYDPCNPYTNMEELRDIQSKLKKGDKKAIEAKKAEIRDIQQKNKKNPRVVATTTFALNQLDNKKIEETIRNREDTLKIQALQMVWAQVDIALKKGNPFKEGELKIAHIGLLNEDNISMDQKSGWYHHEGNEILDMNSVFEFLNGKKIFFDGTGPFISDDGSIHMPYKRTEVPSEVTIVAAFFNISIQGGLKNKGQLQKNLNLHNAQKINFELPSRKSKGVFRHSETSVEYSTRLHNSLEMKGFQTSISCLSGKDRTGWVAYQICLNKIKNSGMKRPKGLDTPGFNILRDILEQNYGKRVIKVVKTRLKGISKIDHAWLVSKQLGDVIGKTSPLRGRNGKPIELDDEENSKKTLFSDGAEAASSGSEDEMEIV